MDIAVLDACPGFKEDVLHAAQDRDESVEVVQGVDQQRKRLAENNLSVCGYFSAVFSSQHLSLSGQYFGAGLCSHIV